MKTKKRKAYISDLTDDEWNRIKLLIYQDNYCAGKDRTKFCEMLNAVFCILSTGCQWRNIPNDFPLWKSVYAQFMRWKEKGLFIQIHDYLRATLRQALGRNMEASVRIADNIKTAEKKGFLDLTQIRKLKVGKDTYWLITLDS